MGQFPVFLLFLVYLTPGYDGNDSSSYGFVEAFLWPLLAIRDAATCFAGSCVSVRQMKSSRPCMSRRSPSSFPRSFLASHWNTATALGFEPAGHRRRCLAVGAAFAPQTAVPYFLQGKGGRPYGGILWSRFSPWVPVGPCWPRSKFRHILLGVCYFWQLECFKFWTRTDKIKLSFIWRWISSFFGRSLLN